VEDEEHNLDKEFSQRSKRAEKGYKESFKSEQGVTGKEQKEYDKAETTQVSELQTFGKTCRKGPH